MEVLRPSHTASGGRAIDPKEQHSKRWNQNQREPEVAQSKTPKTAQDLMDVMGENIARLRDGEATPAIANAIVNSASSMLRVVKLQMEYSKMTGTKPNIPRLLTGE
jgi:hypothetical protein